MIPNQLAAENLISGYLHFEKAYIKVPAPTNFCGDFWAEIVPECKIPFQLEKMFDNTYQNAPVGVFSYTITGVKYNFRLYMNPGTNCDGDGYSFPSVVPSKRKAGICIDMYPSSVVVRKPMYKSITMNVVGEALIGSGEMESSISFNVSETFTETHTISTLKKINSHIGILVSATATGNATQSIMPPAYTDSLACGCIGMFMKIDENGKWCILEQSAYSFRYSHSVPAMTILPTDSASNTEPTDPEIASRWKKIAFREPNNPYKDKPTTTAVGFLYNQYTPIITRTTAWEPNTINGYDILQDTYGRPSDTKYYTSNSLAGLFTMQYGTSSKPRAMYEDDVPRDALRFISIDTEIEDHAFPMIAGSNANGWDASSIPTMTASFSYVTEDPLNNDQYFFRQKDWSSVNNYNYTGTIDAEFDGNNTITATYDPSIIANIANSNYPGYQAGDHPFSVLPSITYTLFLAEEGEIIDTYQHSYSHTAFDVIQPQTGNGHGYALTYITRVDVSEDFNTLTRKVSYTLGEYGTVISGECVVTSVQTFNVSEAIPNYETGSVNVLTSQTTLTTGFISYIPNFESIEGDSIDLAFTMTNSLGEFQIPFKLVFNSDRTRFQPEAI